MRSRSIFLVITALILSALACNVAGFEPVRTPARLPEGTPLPAVDAPTSAPAVAPPTLAPQTLGPVLSSTEEQQLIQLYASVNPSVVSINVFTASGGGSGSGFVYDKDGHVVTNEHVVEDAQSIEVDFASGFKARATVVGVDLDADLAVIKVEAPAEELVPVVLGDSDQVQVGQRAVAIGNPFGEAGTMTLGIISGLGRTLDSTRIAEGGGRFSAPDIIQTDAPINPGNSGGPLLNLSGEVIGVNRAINVDPETGRSSGIGYAIASNTVRQIVPYLIREGKFVYPFLGITSTPEMSLELQEQLGLAQASGTYVVGLTAGGPAEQAGLRADSSTGAGRVNGDGDLIIAIDGRPVRVQSDLLSYLINHARPGQAVTLTVVRQGETVEVSVTLGERP
jgi:2-alkenal reductase